MKFKQKYTDEVVLEALRKCIEKATVPAADVAEELQGNPRYIKNILMDLKERGLITGENKGKAWGFRPK